MFSRSNSGSQRGKQHDVKKDVNTKHQQSKHSSSAAHNGNSHVCASTPNAITPKAYQKEMMIDFPLSPIEADDVGSLKAHNNKDAVSRKSRTRQTPKVWIPEEKLSHENDLGISSPGIYPVSPNPVNGQNVCLPKSKRSQDIEHHGVDTRYAAASYGAKSPLVSTPSTGSVKVTSHLTERELGHSVSIDSLKNIDSNCNENDDNRAPDFCAANEGFSVTDGAPKSGGFGGEVTVDDEEDFESSNSAYSSSSMSLDDVEAPKKPALVASSCCDVATRTPPDVENGASVGHLETAAVKSVSDRCRQRCDNVETSFVRIRPVAHKASVTSAQSVSSNASTKPVTNEKSSRRDGPAPVGAQPKCKRTPSYASANDALSPWHVQNIEAPRRDGVIVSPKSGYTLMTEL